MLLLCCGMVPASASAAGTGSYVALGDSISAGYGLGEGELSFPERLAQSTGYALADFSSSEGVTSQALLETLSQPEVADAVKNADVITITVGGNDLMNALYEYLAEASGTMTADEIREGLENGSFDMFALMGLMQQLDGFPISSQASAALTALSTNLSSALAQIKGMNPDAACIVANQYNPYGHINNPFAADIVSTFEVGVRALNTTLERFAQARGATVADVHSAFAASSANPCNAYFTGLNNFSLDFHPNALGHQLIAEEVEQALPEPDPVQTYDVWVAGTQVSDDNAGDVLGDSTVSYDPASQTLELNSATIDYRENAGDNAKGAIMFDGDLTIVLKGDNRITSVTSGISCNGAGELTIRGDQLTIESTSYGIEGVDDTGRDITVSGAKLTIEVDTMSGFTAAGIQAAGLLSIADGAVLDITGATDEAAALIGNGGISIVGSTVSARIAAAGAYGVGVILSDRDITIDNSIVDVHADHAYNFGILAGNDLIPSEGTITIKNNSQVTVSAASGIAVHTMVGDVVIEDSKVVATSSGHNAMYVNGDITISGASDVTVSSPYAAFAPDDSITIDPKGGLVDVWEGSSEENASKTADSPLSQSATLEIASKFFHSAPHVHAFIERVEDDTYLASMATCTDPAAYYLSCECGAAGTDTFSAGGALGHSWGEWEVVTPATCTESGVEGRACASCGATESREIAATGHDFVDGACAACGEKDPSFVTPDEPEKDEPKKSDPVKDESALPAAGDAGSLAALVPALAGASVLATGIILRRRG